MSYTRLRKEWRTLSRLRRFANPSVTAHIFQRTNVQMKKFNGFVKKHAESPVRKGMTA